MSRIAFATRSCPHVIAALEQHTACAPLLATACDAASFPELWLGAADDVPTPAPIELPGDDDVGADVVEFMANVVRGVHHGPHCARMTTAAGEPTGSSLPHEKQRSG